MDFSDKPIIIEGVNHSGSRVIVEMLTIMGSDGGNDDNIWRENEFFLQIHKDLIEKISDKGWTKTILNIPFISNYVDDCSFQNEIENRINNQLINFYPNFKYRPWHWKCPTSALFEKTWTNIFPDAYYIILKRDPASVAKSFVRRNASLSFRDGLKFYNIMEEKIFSISKKRQLVIEYENLKEEVERIADFIPIDVDANQIDKAISIIKTQRELKYRDKSFRMIYKQFKADLVYMLYKNGLIGQ